MLLSLYRRPISTGATRRQGRSPTTTTTGPLFHRWTSLFLLIVFSIQVRGGGRAEVGGGALCGRLAGLWPRQRALCGRAPAAVAAAGDGARLAAAECRRDFAPHRWNCTGVIGGARGPFGHVLTVGSREAAFTYAIVSAGVAYAVTAACARGDIPACGCDRRRPAPPPGGWRWGGCGADVTYGARFARRFLDARELEGDARSLMNLHNNRAGRKMVKASLQTECKCHGVSGSCTMKTCWKSLPPFSQVGEALMKKYNRARYVMASSLRVTQPELQLLLKKSRSHQPISKRLPKKSDLVFLEESPNYCERDTSVGSLGTIGRFCNRTSKGNDGCDLMCCGRGYNTHQYVRTTQCNCKFHWCCYVNCDVCTEKREEYTCK